MIPGQTKCQDLTIFFLLRVVFAHIQEKRPYIYYDVERQCLLIWQTFVVPWVP